jgi:hypothetical protein
MVKGVRDNSGNASRGGWTLLDIAAGKGKVKAIRNETKQPKRRTK